MASGPIPAHIAAIERPVPNLFRYYVFKSIAALFGFPVLFAVLYFRYHTLRYHFSEEGIRMSWGIIFRNEVMLNYARIQDIHLRSNAVERWLGLARIEIQTASGSSESVMVLEGLTDHEAMRDFLYSRMRGASSKSQPEAAQPLAATMLEIAAELRAIRAALAERPNV